MQLAGCLKGNGAYTKNTQNLPRCPMTSEIKKHQSSEDATAQRRRAPKLGGGGRGGGEGAAFTTANKPFQIGSEIF